MTAADGTVRAGPRGAADDRPVERAHHDPPAPARRGRQPGGVLYGRLPGYHLSERRARDGRPRRRAPVADRDIVHLVSRPLERAQETAAPVAEPCSGCRSRSTTGVIEAEQRLPGHAVRRRRRFAAPTVGTGGTSQPVPPVVGRALQRGRPRGCGRCATRRAAAAGTRRSSCRHQLPIWTLRCAVEGRRLVARPAQAPVQPGQRHLDAPTGEAASSTVDYAEPAADLVPARATQKFSAGA